MQIIESNMKEKINYIIVSCLLIFIIGCKKETGERLPNIKMIDYIDEYGINHGKGIEIDGKVWAPVNCGYHENNYKFGKLYQWGRKDGHFYYNLYNPEHNDASQTEESNKNLLAEGPISLDKLDPTKFYTTYNTDWNINSSPNLWNASWSEENGDINPTRTEYDPCPEGWRVPTATELDDVENNHSRWFWYEDPELNLPPYGFWFCGTTTFSEEILNKVFFDAGGYRSCRGDSNRRTSAGLYWSSTPIDMNYAAFLWFYPGSDGQGIMDVDYKATGAHVRCIQLDV